MSVPESAKIFDYGVGAFTMEELDRLEHYCDRLEQIHASLRGPQGDYVNDAIRVARIASIRQAPDIMWFYERLAAIVRTFNSRTFHFDLRGFSEPPQYMVYHHSEAAHFDWHMDTGTPPPRKLSLTLQLSDASAYQGGDLEINTGTIILATPRERGAAIGFASYTIHRVTPVTAGTRKAVVAWVTGPDFK